MCQPEKKNISSLFEQKKLKTGKLDVGVYVDDILLAANNISTTPK